MNIHFRYTGADKLTELCRNLDTYVKITPVEEIDKNKIVTMTYMLLK